MDTVIKAINPFEATPTRFQCIGQAAHIFDCYDGWTAYERCRERELEEFEILAGEELAGLAARERELANGIYGRPEWGCHPAEAINIKPVTQLIAALQKGNASTTAWFEDRIQKELRARRPDLFIRPALVAETEPEEDSYAGPDILAIAKFHMEDAL